MYIPKLILVEKKLRKLKMKLKRAFKLKQVKIHKNLNDYLKKYIDDKKIYSDLVRLRELIDEQDKLLGID